MLEMIILAAGKGKRMNSSLPKVLSRLAGQPLLQWVINASLAVDAERIHIVYGHQGEQLRQHFTDDHLHWVEQKEQLGTGHAVSQALQNITDDAKILVLYGDVPLISAATLKNLIAATPVQGVGILTAIFDDPKGYGRILRDDAGHITGIVEEKDSDDEQRAIKEINTGIMCSSAKNLKKWLAQIKPNNAQGEYYLTDIVALAVSENKSITSVNAAYKEEVLGVNDRVQLSNLERQYQRLQAEQLLKAGVTLIDPARIDIRGTVKTGQDVILDINVILEGQVELGDRVQIGPNCVLHDVKIADNVIVKANSVLEETVIAKDCVIGPFARIRPGTVLAQGVHIGNFVELKKADVGAESKIGHLTYIGDAVIGKQVNIGAGTITCNYDGVHKYQTTIKNGVFIGSGTQLVAPVTLGAGAYIGAGSTITEDAPADKLSLARARQVTIESWQKPDKK